jgi:hypothetical protein
MAKQKVSKGRKPTHPPASDAKKNLSRDSRGRYLKGQTGNPHGRPPITPELKAVKALAEVERVSNVAELVRLRDNSADEWVRIECIKLLLMYSDGKPVTAHVGSPLVGVNFNLGAGAMGGAGGLTPEAAYQLMVSGALPADPDHEAFRPAIEHKPEVAQ